MISYAFTLAAMLVLPQTTVTKSVPSTAEGMFLEAVKHWGDSTTDVAIVTVISGKHQSEKAVCVEVSSLAFAVAKERGLKVDRDTYQEITTIMSANKDRRFTFTNPEALAFLDGGAGNPDFDPEVCSYVRAGVYAFRGDRPGTLYVGQLHN